MSPKSFMKYFPEATLMAKDLPLEAPKEKTTIIIKCTDLDTLKQKLKKLGYTIEIKKIGS